MKLQFYLEKLHSSEDFQEFEKENPKAYICSCFFILDKENKNNKVHFDYFLPEGKKIISFQLESGIQKIPLEIFDKKVPEKISFESDLDFDEIEDIIVRKMEKENIKDKIQKIIFSLQRLSGKDFLMGTVFVSMLGMIKINIDIKEKKVTEFEKKSLFDILRITHRKNDK